MVVPGEHGCAYKEAAIKRELAEKEYHRQLYGSVKEKESEGEGLKLKEPRMFSGVSHLRQRCHATIPKKIAQNIAALNQPACSRDRLNT